MLKEIQESLFSISFLFFLTLLHVLLVSLPLLSPISLPVYSTLQPGFHQWPSQSSFRVQQHIHLGIIHLRAVGHHLISLRPWHTEWFRVQTNWQTTPKLCYTTKSTELQLLSVQFHMCARKNWLLLQTSVKTRLERLQYVHAWLWFHSPLRRNDGPAFQEDTHPFFCLSSFSMVHDVWQRISEPLDKLAKLLALTIAQDMEYVVPVRATIAV